MWHCLKKVLCSKLSMNMQSAGHCASVCSKCLQRVLKVLDFESSNLFCCVKHWLVNELITVAAKAEVCMVLDHSNTDC
jgi:hypothetical protein